MLAALCFAVGGPGDTPVFDRTIVLNDHALRLHFANAGPRPAHPLLVYATGDGGWHRKDRAAYEHLVSFGSPIVGFDARDYVTHLGSAETTTPEKLAADYRRIIDEARDALRLPLAYPVVLVGISRGAGLSVVAAGQPDLRATIAGVLAVALTREEEYVKWYRRLLRRPPRAADPEMVATYEYLPLLGDMPVAVIQSTRDGYLPAADARPLFGPDTPYRWLLPVEARNHSFGGARPELYDYMERALRWIESVLRPAPLPRPGVAAPGVRPPTLSPPGSDPVLCPLRGQTPYSDPPGSDPVLCPLRGQTPYSDPPGSDPVL